MSGRRSAQSTKNGLRQGHRRRSYATGQKIIATRSTSITLETSRVMKNVSGWLRQMTANWQTKTLYLLLNFLIPTGMDAFQMLRSAVTFQVVSVRPAPMKPAGWIPSARMGRRVTAGPALHRATGIGKVTRLPVWSKPNVQKLAGCVCLWRARA